ncbi:MAG: PEPxxWA-CTERM sorting domain-containing protein [Pseudomonadota bacterium]
MAAASVLTCAGQAAAAVLYDSGTPTELGDSLSHGQWLAAMLQFGSAATITDVEGFFDTNHAGDVEIALLSSSGGLPASTLFSSTVAVPGGVNDWAGVHGLNWSIAAGNYWFAFEVQPASTYIGGLGDKAPNPVTHYAFKDVADSLDWQAEAPKGYGVRVSGTGGDPVTFGAPGGVPEPATWALLLTGFGGLGAMLRRRRLAPY